MKQSVSLPRQSNLFSAIEAWLESENGFCSLLMEESVTNFFGFCFAGNFPLPTFAASKLYRGTAADQKSAFFVPIHNYSSITAHVSASGNAPKDLAIKFLTARRAVFLSKLYRMKNEVSLTRQSNLFSAIAAWLESENGFCSLLMEESVTNLQLVRMMLLFVCITVAVFSGFSTITLVALLAAAVLVGSISKEGGEA